MKQFLHSLGGCSTTAEILDTLLAESAVRDLGVSAVRYYRRGSHGQTEFLESVDCAGQSWRVATRMRAGQLANTRPPGGTGGWEAMFDVIDASGHRPTVFQLFPALSTKWRLAHRNPLLLYHLREDGFEADLGPGQDRPAWADVPLVMAGRVCGKLSCTLAHGRFGDDEPVSPTLHAKLLEFQRLVGVIVPYLESLIAFDLNSPLEEAGREIFRQPTYDKLYQYLTDDLRRLAPFNFEGADILIVAPDTMKKFGAIPDELLAFRDGIRDDCELLKLRASSYKLAMEEGWINRRYYRKFAWKDPRPWLTAAPQRPDKDWDDPASEGCGLTPWVWRTGQTLRLNRIGDTDEYKRQLALYAPEHELKWVGKIRTSLSHDSLLMVPIFEPPREKRDDSEGDGRVSAARRVIGVLRFANKLGGADIEPREEVLLRRIADRCIGPKIVSLKYEQFTHQFMGSPLKLVLTRPDFTPDAESIKAVNGQLVEAIKKFFPTNEGRKVFLLCRTDQQKTQYYPHVVYATAPHDANLFSRWYPLEGSLTEFAIKFRKELGGDVKDFVFVNDMAFAQACGRYVRVMDDIRCALASAIRFQDEDFGAFVILSDRYDITPAAYGRIVQVIAQQLGWLIKRAEIADFAVAAVKGIEHDLPELLKQVRNRLENDKLTPAEGERVLDYATILTRAYSLTAPPPVDVLLKSAVNRDVKERIQTAFDMATFVHIEGNAPRPTLQFIDGGAGKVRVTADFLDACLFNLMKNAIFSLDSIAEPGGGRKSIEVSTAVNDGFLMIEVTNECDQPVGTLTPLIGESVSSTRLPITALFEGAPHEHSGLILIRTLARWCRVPVPGTDISRRGEFSFETPFSDRITFRIRLPMFAH